jgi:hypothetical protein
MTEDRRLSTGTLLTNRAGTLFQLTGDRDERGWWRAVISELTTEARAKGWLTGEVVYLCPDDIRPGALEVVAG